MRALPAPPGGVAAGGRFACEGTGGFVGRGEPKSKGKAAFTLKISLACKAGARECLCSLAEVCLPGTRCLCPRPQRGGGLEGPFFPGCRFYRSPAGLDVEKSSKPRINKSSCIWASCAAGLRGLSRAGGTPLPGGLLSQHCPPRLLGDTARAGHAAPLTAAHGAPSGTEAKAAGRTATIGHFPTF